MLFVQRVLLLALVAKRVGGFRVPFPKARGQPLSHLALPRGRVPCSRMFATERIGGDASTDNVQQKDITCTFEEENDIGCLSYWIKNKCNLTVRKADKYARLLYCNHDVANQQALGKRVGREVGLLAKAGVAAEDAEDIMEGLRLNGLLRDPTRDEEREAESKREEERRRAEKRKKEEEKEMEAVEDREKESRAKKAAEKAVLWAALQDGAGRRIYDAAGKGDVGVLKWMVQEWSGDDVVLNWANPNACRDAAYSGSTALTIGCGKGNLEAVKLLLATPGIDVNREDDAGRTALRHAAYWGRVKVVAALLKAPGVDVSAVDNYGRTAVMEAARNTKSGALQALLAAPGVDVNAVDGEGCTALAIAAKEGCEQGVETLLAVPGLDVNRVDRSGMTALMHAAWEGRNTNVARALLGVRRVYLDTRARCGKTALGFARLNEYSYERKEKTKREIVALLEQVGALE